METDNRVIKIYTAYHTEKISMNKFLESKGIMPDYNIPKWDDTNKVVWFYQTTDKLIETLNWYMIIRNIPIRFERG